MATQDERKAETRALLIDAACRPVRPQGLPRRFGRSGGRCRPTAPPAPSTATFGNKEGLLLALLEVWMERTVADLRPALEGVTDLDDRLAALWSGIVRGR